MDTPDSSDYREEPLDFSRPLHLRRCPYCGETLSTEEIRDFIMPQSNTFVCPNCRKKLNIHELGTGI